MDKFQIFDFKFNDEELEEKFHDFFYRYGLTPLFTNEHRAPSISVTWTDAKSIIKTGNGYGEGAGSYHTVLTNFADILSIATDNKNYETFMFKILYQARTFQKLIQNIKKVIEEFSTMPENYLHNMWNVVWYEKVLGV